MQTIQTSDDTTCFLVCGNTDGKSEPFGFVSNTSDVQLRYRSKISNTAKNFLIQVEDKRYYSHKGIDVRGIARAIYVNIKALSIIQGGSTLTQQLARNLIRNNRKSVSRKVREMKLALSLENKYSKEEILQEYFNKVYWGKNIYGVRAASITYFDKEPFQLSKREYLQLITLLRGPNLYLFKPELLKARYDALVDLLISRNVLKPNKEIVYKKSDTRIQIKRKLSVIKPKALPFIALKMDYYNSKVVSSIDIELQNFFERLVQEAKYPTSIVCIMKNQVVAFASYYGNDYPFTFKSNVGSSLKPFVYYFLRRNGITSNELISTTSSTKWNVREVQHSDESEMTLKRALKLSNNNVFLNAAEKIGMSDVLGFLSQLLNKRDETLYPSAILGTSYSGISLYELTKLYHNFFSDEIDKEKEECYNVLKEILYEKTGVRISNGFFKSGTTNDNKERFSLFGNKLLTVGILRQNYFENDYSKEGNFLSFISDTLRNLISLKRKWFK